MFLQRVGESLPLDPPVKPIVPVIFDSSSYIGDGAPDREFNIGFTPRILFIFSALAIGIKIDSMPGDVIFIGMGLGNGVIITPTGFIISAAGTANLNNVGATFYFFGAR